MREVQQAIINIGAQRRITLPAFINAGEGEQLLFKEMENGNFEVSKYTNAPKKKIYGVIIGKEFPENMPLVPPVGMRWWGIFVDSNGIILGRQRASTLEYLQKDLSCPDKRGREKLDSAVGRGLWEWPIVLFNLGEVEGQNNTSLTRTVLDIKFRFFDGTWPPVQN